MSNDLRIAIVGLDSSHSIEFTRRMQAPDCPADQQIKGMRTVSCLRFGTPFQDEEGLDSRQAQLEAWGVKVVTDFDEAVADCDAIMIVINDAAYHLDYFMKCADLGKPIFLDKPLADNIENGRLICRIARDKGVKVFSSSSLRYPPQLEAACETMPAPLFSSTYGPLGDAPAGSSVIWYGVHAFEMLQRAMGIGAVEVFARRDKTGVVATVAYTDNRRGVVELTDEAYFYGGCLRNAEKGVQFTVDSSALYAEELRRIGDFFKGGDPVVSLDDTLEVMAMLDAADRSVKSGKAEKV